MERTAVKTVSVRIKAEQAAQLQEVVSAFPGGSLNGIVQRAVDLLLEIEVPVYAAKLKEARQKLRKDRQAVSARLP